MTFEWRRTGETGAYVESFCGPMRTDANDANLTT